MSYPYGGINAVSLGTGAGSTLQGATAIAIGYQAGAVLQPASSIIINASGTALSGVAPNALYMDPVRNLAASTLMMYDTVNKEVVYSSTLNNTLTVNNLISLSTLSASTVSFSTLSVNVANVSTSNVQFINFSTLLGSTLGANTANISTLTVNQGTVSSLSVGNVLFSTLTGSTVSTTIANASTFLGNTGFITSTFTVSTLIAANISVSTLNLSLFSTLTGSSITTSTLALSTMSGNTGFFTSTLTVSTLIAANISVSTLNLSLFSTLTGSSITTSTLVLSTFSGNTGFIASTLTVSTLIAANINVSSLALNQFSTLTGSSLIASTIAISTITANTGFFNSTLIVSTLYASSIVVPSLTLNQFSTLTGSSLTASTIAVSTISMNTGFAFSTFTVSTLIAANINVSSLALNQFSTLTGSSLIASTLFISTTTTSTLFGQYINYSTLTGSTMNGNVTYSNLLLFSSISSINGSSFGITGPTGPIGQASQISFFAPGSQSIGPSTAMGVVTLTTLDPTQTTGITGFAFSSVTSLFTNATIQAIPVTASYFLSLNTTAGGYSAVGLTVLGVTTYFGGMYNDSNSISNSVSVLVPAGGSVGLYYMDNTTIIVQAATRFTVTSNQVGQQGTTGVTGVTGPTGPVGQVSQLAYGSTGISQTIVPTGTLSTLVQWPAAAQDAAQSIGLSGLLYNYSGSPTGTFTNITTAILPISVEYTLNLTTSAGGYSAIGINGPNNIFGGNYNDNNGFSNNATILVAPGAYFGVYYMDNTSVSVLANSRIICTLLTAGGQGPTGMTGPAVLAAVMSYKLGSVQTIPAVTATQVNFSVNDATQTINGTGILPSAGAFTNNSQMILPVLIEYTIQQDVTGNGSTYIQLSNAGAGSGSFATMLTATNIYNNSFVVTMIPGATVAVFVYDNSVINLQIAYTRITLTVLQAGPIGPTGLTGPALWSATGSVAPYGVPITYAQGFVGVGAGPTGASFLQTNSGGSTAGTGSSVPQYTLDVVGSERVNGARLFADGSAQVSAADALDYTTFGQNWTATTLSIGNWHCVAISANGAYQTVGTNGAGINYSSNYGQSWSVPTGINVAAVVNSIAVSASGQYQLAAVQGTYAGLYYSTNYGASWTASSASSSAWYEVCISASGQYASAVINASTVTYYSTNYGVTWTASMSPSGQYATISCSASGQYQVAATGAGTVYYSSSYGQSWSASNMSAVGSLQDSAMSASGQYVSIATNAVGVWYSSNYGQTFVQVTAVIGTFNLRQIAMSASGQYQLVSGFTGGMYYSTNYGVNWTQGSSSVAWYSVAISANGQYCIGCIYNGLVYLSVTRSPSLYTSGSIISAASTDLILDSQGTTTGWTSFYLKNLNSAYNPPSAPYNVSPYGMSIGFNASTTGAIDLVNDYGIGGFIFYNRAATSGTYAATLTQLAIITSSGLTVPGTINSAKLNYNSTFDTLYLGNTFPASLATGAVNNTFFGINTGFSNTIGNTNTLIGKSAGYFNQTGNNNTYVGNGAGYGVSGFSSSNNSFFGVNAGLFVVGSNNTCIGQGAGQGAGAGVSTYTDSTLVGQNAGFSLTTGGANTLIGKNAGFESTTGNLNTCIGASAGYYNKTGIENVCIGVTAGLGAITSTYDSTVAVGKDAGFSLTTANANTIIGWKAGYSATTGGNNTIGGYEAGKNITTGNLNTFFGFQAGQGAVAGSASIQNVAIGYQCLYLVTAGQFNVAIGTQSLYSLTSNATPSAGGSVGIGNQALYGVTTGNYNIGVGQSSGNNLTTGTFCTYLGTNSFASGINPTAETVIGGTTGNGSNTCTIKVNNNGFYLSGYTSAGTLSNTAAGQVTSSSDIRVKSNIVYLPTAGSTDTIMGLKPVSFDLQFDPYKRYTGFIADEVQLVMPGCVDGKKHKFQWETDDEVDANGNIIKHGKKPKVDANGNVIYKKDENGELIPRYLGMDYNEVTSRLVLAFQEQVGIIQQQAITITNQTQTITALQSQLTAQQIQMDQILQRLAAANIA